jgi:formylmethanofuran dehydrogenase subunit E
MRKENTIKGKPHRNSYKGGLRKCGFCGESNRLDETTKYKNNKPLCKHCNRATLRNGPRSKKNIEMPRL